MAMTSDPVGRIRTGKERYSTTCPAYSVRLNGGFKNPGLRSAFKLSGCSACWCGRGRRHGAFTLVLRKDMWRATDLRNRTDLDLVGSRFLWIFSLSF